MHRSSGRRRWAPPSASEWPAPARTALRSLALSLPHATYGRNRLLALARTMRGRYAGTVALPVRESEGGLLRRELAAYAVPFEQVLDRWFDDTAARDFMTQLTMVDVQSYLPGDILTKVDRMSMATSLEARVPILDHRVAEFALSLPASVKFRDGVGKWALREAIADRVPREVFTRPKQGFDVPLREWFRGPLSYRLTSLLGPASSIYEYVEPTAVRRIVAEHRAGRRDHARTLWRLMMLEEWARLVASGALATRVTIGDDVGLLVGRARAERALALTLGDVRRLPSQ